MWQVGQARAKVTTPLVPLAPSRIVFLRITGKGKNAVFSQDQHGWRVDFGFLSGSDGA